MVQPITHIRSDQVITKSIIAISKFMIIELMLTEMYLHSINLPQIEYIRDDDVAR